MPVGALRYGQIVPNQYGDNLEWRHWCALTFSIRNEVNSVHVQGVVSLRISFEI